MTSANSPSPFQVTASSSWTESEFPIYAAWSSTRTWCPASNDVNAWTQLKLDKNYSVFSFAMTSRGGTNLYWTTFTIKGSNDGINFVSIQTFTGLIWGSNETKIFLLDNFNNYQYYRVQFGAPAGSGNQYGIHGIKLFGF
jgi:hypothetical protein